MNRKPIFDTVRALLGRGFTRSEVTAIDRAMDAAQSGEQTAPPHHVGPAGIALVKQFEGCARQRTDGRYDAYPDPGTGGDPWTIGWGTTGPGIGPGTIWTQDQCDARLESDLARFAVQVASVIGTAPTTQNQFDALVSFHYNTGAIASATLTKQHLAGEYGAAAREFLRWNRAGGRVMPGLTRRREAEAALYSGQ